MSNEELRGLLARRAVDHALRLTGPLPPDATPTQRLAMSELVEAADNLAADAMAAWRVMTEGAPDQESRQVMALLVVVQAVAVLAIGRAYRIASSSADDEVGGDAPIQ